MPIRRLFAILIPMIFIIIVIHFHNKKQNQWTSSSTARNWNLEKYLMETESKNCDDLAVGEKRNFNWTKDQSPTLIPTHYQLLRLSSSSYQIGFNIGLVGDPQDVLEMTETINQCLERANPYLKDSLNRQLKLKVYFQTTPEIANVKKVNIDVGRTFHTLSVNMRKFIVEMPCAHIVHELMHNTGLIDEYDIKSNFKGNLGSGHSEKAFDCRPKFADRLSIMNDPFSIGDRAGINRKYQFLKCKCKSGLPKLQDAACALAAPRTSDESFALKTCPEGFVEHERQDLHEWDFKYQKENGNFEPDQLPGILVDVKTIYDPINPTSLFLPGHIDHVLFPGCDKKSGKYLVCARNGYRSSSDTDGCLPFPMELCQGDEDWRL
jgi:hypothetical protein